MRIFNEIVLCSSQTRWHNLDKILRSHSRKTLFRLYCGSMTLTIKWKRPNRSACAIEMTMQEIKLLINLCKCEQHFNNYVTCKLHRWCDATSSRKVCTLWSSLKLNDHENVDDTWTKIKVDQITLIYLIHSETQFAVKEKFHEAWRKKRKKYAESIPFGAFLNG